MKTKISNKEVKIDLEALQIKDLWFFAGILFISSFMYFLLPANHVLSFQEEQYLFLFSGEYLKSFLVKPGGILEYTGKFLTQFYALPLAGALIVAISLSMPGILVFKILKKINSEPALIIPLSVFPSVLLLLMQNQYYHLMEYNMGFICILAYILVTFKYRRFYLQIILFPVLYYLVGAYALIFSLYDIIYAIRREEGYRRYSVPFILLIVSILSYFLFKNVLFLVTQKSLITYPLPLVNEHFHRAVFIILTFYIIFFQFLSNLRIPQKTRQKAIRSTGVITSGILIFCGLLLLTGMYDPSIATVMRIQRSAYKGNWDEVIRLNEKSPSENLLSQYFYNTALSEKGLLCDKLFTVGQNFGTRSLILPWGDQHLERGAYFFYSAGLTKEAHRWAYEEMVVYGLRPHNLMMLINTSLIDENYRMAEKYINILRKTAFYRDEAQKYEKMLKDKEISDSEMASIARVKPLKDFFVYMDAPEDNLLMLYESNPANKRAFEYMTSWLLLEKDIETVLSNIHILRDLGYTRLPRYIEEAVMIYYNSQKAFPEMSGFTVSKATLTRFEQYFSTFVTARNNPATLQITMKENFGDTFWYYFHFQQ